MIEGINDLSNGYAHFGRRFGANRDFILNRIPHLSNLMVKGIDAVLVHAQRIVIDNRDPQFEGVLERLRDGRRTVCRKLEIRE